MVYKLKKIIDIALVFSVIYFKQRRLLDFILASKRDLLNLVLALTFTTHYKKHFIRKHFKYKFNNVSGN